MSIATRLSRVAAVPLAPVLLVQGRRLRATTPRLPDAAAPWFGEIPGPDPIRLLVFGDSTAAGVGVEHQEDGLVGSLAAELHARTARGVVWRALGENGATSRDLRERFLGDTLEESWDLVFLSLGANDALGLRSRGAFRGDVGAIIDALRARNPDATILMSSLPAFSRFELLPNPLRWNLYLHSRSLEEGAREAIAARAGTAMSPPPPPYTEGFFATDLFHPSASGYADWARFALDDAAAQGVLA